MYKYFLIVAISLISACSSLQFPGVYKIRIEQGNVIKQEMVDQLKPGMSKEQVEFIMGSALLKDTFNSDRWDYIYTAQRGDVLNVKSRMTIYFKDDKLSHFTGDYVPSENKESSAEGNIESSTKEDKESSTQENIGKSVV